MICLVLNMVFSFKGFQMCHSILASRIKLTAFWSLRGYVYQIGFELHVQVTAPISKKEKKDNLVIVH